MNRRLKMNESAARAERLPYWDRYERMSYAELKRLIHDAVDRLQAASASDDEDLPSSQEELVTLCDLLSVKAEQLKGDTTMPERPTYDGPLDPGYFLTPSDELRSLYNKRERFQRNVENAYRDGASDIFIEYVENELEKVEQEVAPIERREEEEHDKRVAEYREAHEPYLRRFRLWRAEVEKVEKRREAEAKRDAAVQRAYRKVERAFDPKRASGSRRMSILPWEIAAPGERTDDRAVYRYYREVVSRGGLKEFDQDRLDKILALPYENWSKGSAGFYGYIILYFAHTPKVLMECPVPDNAIYVLDSGEKRLLKMNKQELMASDETTRIYHMGPWYERVRKELGIT
jgi:hypothetical protein